MGGKAKLDSPEDFFVSLFVRTYGDSIRSTISTTMADSRLDDTEKVEIAFSISETASSKLRNANIVLDHLDCSTPQST